MSQKQENNLNNQLLSNQAPQGNVKVESKEIPKTKNITKVRKSFVKITYIKRSLQPKMKLQAQWLASNFRKSNGSLRQQQKAKYKCEPIACFQIENVGSEVKGQLAMPKVDDESIKDNSTSFFTQFVQLYNYLDYSH